jgi:hypothetical protein
MHPKRIEAPNQVSLCLPSEHYWRRELPSACCGGEIALSHKLTAEVLRNLACSRVQRTKLGKLTFLARGVGVANRRALVRI